MPITVDNVNAVIRTANTTLPPTSGHAGQFLSNNGTSLNWSNSTLSGSVGHFSLASGAVQSGQIASGAVLGQAAGGAYTIASGSIGTFDIGSGAIQSGRIASGQVGFGHLGNGSVQSGTISSGVVGFVHLGNGSVLNSTVGSGQIFGNNLASGSIVSGNIASGQVGFGHLANNSVQSGTIASGVVGFVHLGNGSVQNTTIGSGQVFGNNLASGSINSGNIASGQVGFGHLANNSIKSGTIASGVVGFVHLGDASVLSGTIGSGSVGRVHISSGAITSGRIGATGTPDGTKFLRDDYTWSNTSGAGGGQTYAFLVNGFSASGAGGNVTLSGFTFPIAANEVWAAEVYIDATSNTSGNLFTLKTAVPRSGNLVCIMQHGNQYSNGTGDFFIGGQSTKTSGDVAGGVLAGQPFEAGPLFNKILIRNGNQAGNVSFQKSDDGAIAQAGSYMVARKVN